MRRFQTAAVVTVTMMAIQFGLNSNAQAQEVRKAIRDYRTDRVFNYAPSDPWYRGKLFNTHTGHYGSFYNCDNEECKRNSPYICWKPHTDKDFPTRRGFWQTVKCDFAEAMQRVRDGAGECLGSADCGCAQCQTAPVVTQPCGCAECAGAFADASQNRPGLASVIKRNPQRGSQSLTAQRGVKIAAQDTGGRVNTESGLITGKILGNSSSSSVVNNRTQPAAPTTQPAAKVANQRLLDRYIEASKKR